ncbi:MAG: Tm-1-like ATP-binding domain-containing protein [Caldilineaceae bacterium]
MAKTILMLGAFDTKDEEYAFLREQILAQGHNVLAMNTGVLGSTDRFPVQITAEEVAAAGGGDLAALRQKKDRGEAMKVMSGGAAALVAARYASDPFDGIIGMGGTGGSSVVTAAMRALPIGVPKVCVSTAASGDTSAYVGSKDITMIPSIVDVAGLNRISRIIFTQAAGAISGMVSAVASAATAAQPEDKPIITASMFGNTTDAVNAARAALTEKGYEVFVFHATGTGGKTMEALVREGLVDAVLDITTTEWADTICGGVFDAGPERLSAAGRWGSLISSSPAAWTWPTLAAWVPFRRSARTPVASSTSGTLR